MCEVDALLSKYTPAKNFLTERFSNIAVQYSVLNLKD